MFTLACGSVRAGVELVRRGRAGVARRAVLTACRGSRTRRDSRKGQDRGVQTFNLVAEQAHSGQSALARPPRADPARRESVPCGEHRSRSRMLQSGAGFRRPAVSHLGSAARAAAVLRRRDLSLPIHPSRRSSRQVRPAASRCLRPRFRIGEGPGPSSGSRAESDGPLIPVRAGKCRLARAWRHV